MTEAEVDQLTGNPSIIRNRRKIQATVDNARAYLSATPSLAYLASSYAVDRKRAGVVNDHLHGCFRATDYA